MTDFLLLAFIFLAAGVLAVPIAARLKLGSVLGYLIAGILLSPLLSLLNVDIIAVQHFAEFGVVMMLFLVGLELEPRALWNMRGKLLGLGGGQVALTAICITGCAIVLGQPWTIALAIGLILSLSSTAIALQTLGEKGLLKSDGGKSSFSVLLFQDVAFIPMIALIPLLAIPELTNIAVDVGNTAANHTETIAHEGTDKHAAGLSLVNGVPGWQQGLITLAAIALIAFGGGYMINPLFNFIATTHLRELFTAAALMLVVGIALLMTLVGLSPALGTFLAGVVLATSRYRHELESNIEPFKGLLLGLFFITVGAGVDFNLLSNNLLNIIGLTLGLITLKSGILYLCGTLFGLRGSQRWLFALAIAQAGEFGFVLLAASVGSGVLPSAVADQLLLVVALSMLLTPLLFIVYERFIVPRSETQTEQSEDVIDEDNPIIIAGHGRVGGIVSRMLKGAGYKTTVVDFSSKQIETLDKFGVKAYFGDVTRPDLLHSAGISQAKLLIIAIDNKERITEMVKYVAHTYPSVHIIARAVDRNHVYDLYAAGCRDIIRDTYDGSLRMGRSAFEALGLSSGQAEHAKNAFDSLDRRAIAELAKHYDPNTPASENEAYVRKVREFATEWEVELNDQMKEIMEND